MAVLFECKHLPAFGWVGMSGGSSVAVLRDGSVLFREFVVGQEEPVSEDEIAFIPEAVARIETILNNHEADLGEMPDKLNNGSLDGSNDIFQFGEKIISSWNIERTDLEEVKNRNPEYFEDYKDNMMWENMVLNIYNEILDILNEYDPGLELERK